MIHLKAVLASNLKTHRKALGLTQEKLAEIVNTSPTYIAMIESESRTPSFKMIERLAEALGLEAPALFYMESYPNLRASQIHEALLEQFDKFLRAASNEISAEKSNSFS
ncbi:MAG: helix-turn-helix transcriptional regulator [Treponema sp.]|nr:helix-turn-helix transcriptional regulator [Treponema sp.]